MIKIALGVDFILGALLKGLVLKALQRPESWSNEITSSFDDALSKFLYFSSVAISISIDKKRLLSPLLIEFMVPEAGAAIKTPGFFLSSNKCSPAWTKSPT